MLHGTPQDQIPQMPPSPAQSAGVSGIPSDTTAIPVQTVGADQLPREKGWTYEEMASIVGSLYLDSSHHSKVQEEQFSAVLEEYDKRIMQMKAHAQTQQEEIDSLRKNMATLTRELEVRNDPGSIAPSGDDRGDAMSSS